MNAPTQKPHSAPAAHAGRRLPARRRCAVLWLAAALLGSARAQPPPPDPVGVAVSNTLAQVFDRLATAAAQQPTAATYRHIFGPLARGIDGLYGGSYIDTNFVIREVLHSRHALARGVDLKRVPELAVFWSLMRTNPAPQLSEPARGGLVSPRLVSMRQPVLRAGRLTGILSAMLRTETLLRAAGLDRCRAFRITCQGRVAESSGTLSTTPRTVTIQLPSTVWLIEYDP